MVKTPTRDELADIVKTGHRSIIREADEWRPLASYILGLHALLTKELLQRLKRRIGKDRVRYESLMQEVQGLAKERPFGEANVCALVARYLDEEIEKCDATINGKYGAGTM
jgi:hypothetical protein